MFWMGLWVGGRGSGKTYSCVRLLKLYERFGLYLDGKSCYQRIILMSPTLDANPIWKSLKNFNYKEGDYHEKYSDQLLNEVINEVRREAKATKKYLERKAAYKRAIEAELNSKESKTMSAKDYALLAGIGFEDPDNYKPTYDKPCVTFIVLDDLAGSDAFKLVGRSDLVEKIIKNRHIRTCFAILTQMGNGIIPRTIRCNSSFYVMFKYPGGDVMKDLFEQVNNLVDKKQFEEMYKFATDQPHGSLIAFIANEPRNGGKFMIDWDKVLEFSDKELKKDA